MKSQPLRLIESCEQFFLAMLCHVDDRCQLPQSLRHRLLGHFLIPSVRARQQECSRNWQPADQGVYLQAKCAEQVELRSKLVELRSLSEVGGGHRGQLHGGVAAFDSRFDDGRARFHGVDWLEKCPGYNSTRNFFCAACICLLKPALNRRDRDRDAEREECSNSLRPRRPLAWRQTRPRRPKNPADLRLHPHSPDRSFMELGNYP